MKRSHLRFVSLVLALALTVIFLSPDRVSAAGDTFTLSKTFSNPFTCGMTPASFPATIAPLPGQCVAVNIAITNTSTTDSITSLTLTDNLDARLIGQPGSCFPVVSAGYTCTVTNSNFTFTTNAASYTLGPGATGSENFVVQVAPSTPYGAVIPNTPGATASGAGGAFTNAGSPTAYLTVGSAPASALTATKLVTVNGLGYNTTGVANVNDSLTYQITVTNNTAAPVSNVTVADVLQPGQSLIAAPQTGLPNFSCSYAAPPTLVCTTPTIAAGATARMFFYTVVNGTTSSISNVASVSATGGLSTTTNTTVVTVGSAPPITSGQFLLCGPLTALTLPGAAAGSITISGVAVTIAPGAVIAPNLVSALGSYVCASFALSGGVATALSVGTSSLGAAGLACGAYAPGTTAGTISVGGVSIVVAPGASFQSVLTPGVTYCFLISASGQAFAALSGIPTSVKLLTRHGYAFRPDTIRAE